MYCSRAAGEPDCDLGHIQASSFERLPIAHVDAAALESHGAFLAERLQRATDHFAARAGHRRQQLLGQPRRAAVLVFEQDLRQPTGHVAERQVLDQRQRFAQPSSKGARDGERDARPLGDEAQQVAPSQQVQRAVLDRLGAGGIGALVEDGDLVEHVARTQQPQHLLAATRSRS